MFPPIPSWDGLHPLIVHFPIALLIVVPLLIILGVVSAKHGTAFLYSAFVLMLLGTAATFVAVATGDAAGELAERVAGVDNVLEHHEELAETTRNVFTALTIIFAVIIFAPKLLKKELGRRVTAPLMLAFLVFYSAGTVILINTAHEGGRLVHEFGVKAMVATSGTASQTQTSERKKKDDDDD